MTPLISLKISLRIYIAKSDLKPKLLAILNILQEHHVVW